MINNIVLGIANALNNLGEYDVFVEDVEQGIEAPCFLILLIDADTKQLPSSRNKRRQDFNVLYFPKEGKTECYEMSEKLFEALKLIKFKDGLLNGADIKCNVVDGVLNCLVSYNFNTVKLDDSEYMMELTIKGRVNANE